MAARQVIFTVSGLVQPVWQQQSPSPAWGVEMVDTKSACDKAACPLMMTSSRFPPFPRWVSHKAASLAALYCCGMRPMLSSSGTSPLAVSSQAQHSSRWLSDKQVVFTTSHFPFPVPSLMLTSPPGKECCHDCQDLCLPSKGRLFGTPPVEV